MRPLRRRFPFESWALLFPPPNGHQREAYAPIPALPADLPIEPPVKKRGHPLLAWVVILTLVGLVVYIQSDRAGRREQPPGEDSAPPVAAQERKDPVANALNTAQARYIIGAHSVFPNVGEQFLQELRKLPVSTPEDRLRHIVYAGELGGPKEALKSLDGLRREQQFTPIQQQLMDILRRLYTDYHGLRFTAPSVTAAERELLKERFGWAGELALVPAGVKATNLAEAAGAPLGAALAGTETPNPEERDEVLEPARRTFFVMIGGVCGIGGLALLGLISLIVMGLLAINGKVHGRVVMQRGNGGVYAETFAVWIVLFMALGLLPGLFLPPDFPSWARLALGGAAFFLSLLALLWPVLRGIPWREVRREIGWTTQRRPLVESLWGVAWYVMSLPLLVLGLIVTLTLIMVKGALENAGSGAGMPTGREAAHPIVGEIALADPATLVLIFLLASVAAPIVEETFFRGVLYRHLREATGKWGVFLSVLISGILVSFIFAVIHPQGYLAVPVLMALAFGFTLARENRGSLLPCMVAHGVNNGLVLLMSVLMLSG